VLSSLKVKKPSSRALGRDWLKEVTLVRQIVVKRC
jgi:hypothetical protein